MSNLIERLRAASAAMRSHYAAGAVELIPTWTMDEAADEIERLTAEVRRLDYSTTHTCWNECPRLACAQRREIDALTAQLAEAQTALQTAMTELNGHKDALAQVPEFICRKCGRRQDGPTDNEARF